MLNKDLLKQFETEIAPEMISHLTYTDASKASFDDRFVQAGIVLDATKNWQVQLVDAEGNIAKYYRDLPELKLNAEEQAIADKRVEELKSNPKFYNGDQLLITGVKLDEEAVIVKMTAVRTQFSVLNCISNLKFPQGSSLYQTALYKTGVLFPFITNDNHTVFMQRSADKLHSAAGGLLSPQGDEKSLEYMIIKTAISEATDEFMHDASGKLRVIFDTPKIAGISFRKMKGGMGTVEFVAPGRVHCTRDELEQILSTNSAKNKADHTDQRFYVRLDMKGIEQAKTVLSAKQSGKFLYAPMLASCASIVLKGNENQQWTKEVLGSIGYDQGAALGK